MSEKPPEPEEGAISEGVARLYSHAHVPGTRYWDFSASRKQVQGQFRDRIEREHAERAGVEKAAMTPRTAIEQIRLGQFQVGQSLSEPGSEQSLRRPARSGPAPAPESASREMHQPETVKGATKPAASPLASAEPASPRWYGLRSVFEPADLAHVAALPSVVSPAGLGQHPPMVVVASLAGGVGKTCLVATLGRALSSLGEKVLLIDTASGGLLPFYFGSRACKPGVLRTFSPPPFPPPPSPSLRIENHVPVQLLNLEPERFPSYETGQDLLLGKLLQDGRGASRILVDVGTAHQEVIHRLLLLRPAVLVPILPDMNSMASLPSIEATLDRVAPQSGEIKVFYLLNQFDIASTLHRDLREMLQVRLGDRLLPFVLRSSSSVSEALAEGMTVIDYVPELPIAEDYRRLADWLVRTSAPANFSSRASRWQER